MNHWSHKYTGRRISQRLARFIFKMPPSETIDRILTADGYLSETDLRDWLIQFEYEEAEFVKVAEHWSEQYRGNIRSRRLSIFMMEISINRLSRKIMFISTPTGTGSVHTAYRKFNKFVSSFAPHMAYALKIPRRAIVPTNLRSFTFPELISLDRAGTSASDAAVGLREIMSSLKEDSVAKSKGKQTPANYIHKKNKRAVYKMNKSK